ncbi:MAG: hypothetical protein AAF614_29045 [Chloroflexota bacterium]
MTAIRYLMFVTLIEESGATFFPNFFNHPIEGILASYFPPNDPSPIQFFNDMLKVYNHQIVKEGMISQTISEVDSNQTETGNRIRHMGSYLGMCMFLIDIISLPLVEPFKDIASLGKIQDEAAQIEEGTQIEEDMKQKAATIYQLIDPFLRRNSDGEKDYLAGDNYDLQWILYPIGNLPSTDVPLEDIEFEPLASFRAGVTGWP